MMRQSLKNQGKRTEKAHPFRTSGGIAAKKLNYQTCVDTNDLTSKIFLVYWRYPLSNVVG